MMFAWQFWARTPEEVARLVRCLSKHRYVREADLRMHRLLDRALAHLPEFARHARALDEMAGAPEGLDLSSRDPRLYRPATLDELGMVFAHFWGEAARTELSRANLLSLARDVGLELPVAPAWSSSAEEPPHPELVLLDWVLLPVDELDVAQHRGALAALEDCGEEVDVSAPIHQEATAIGLRELCEGAVDGELTGDFLVWSEPPYAYADYVFRGASKAAKLEKSPEGYNDL